MSFVHHRFILNKRTKQVLRGMEPEFGYGVLGIAIFYRTYSRVKYGKNKSNDNGNGNGNDSVIGQEDWYDVVVRVTEGIFSIRKDFYIKNHIEWNERWWQRYAHNFAITMFKMHWLPPGRGLWIVGTDFLYERGSAAAQNCGFIKIKDDIGECVAWVMDSLMLGIGVGFEPIRNDSFKMCYPKGYKEWKIPDSREGWVESVRMLIDSYCNPNLPEPYFDYSGIREEGLPIKGFGGTSSGPEPLIKLHDQIRHFCIRYIEDNNYDIVRLKTDITNCIGCCVVSGNVRRSAELCVGSIDDETFLNLKDHNVFPERAQWGWMSNNSARLYNDEDYQKLGEIAKRAIKNGEPGIINLRNFQYGRIGKHDKVKRDKATGCNPCGEMLAA